MLWTWHWWIFLPAWVLCTILSLFSRGYMNQANIAKYGDETDYNRDVNGATIGCTIAGAIFAAIISAIAGFLI